MGFPETSIGNQKFAPFGKKKPANFFGGKSPAVLFVSFLAGKLNLAVILEDLGISKLLPYWGDKTSSAKTHELDRVYSKETAYLIYSFTNIFNQQLVTFIGTIFCCRFFDRPRPIYIVRRCFFRVACIASKMCDNSTCRGWIFCCIPKNRKTLQLMAGKTGKHGTHFTTVWGARKNMLEKQGNIYIKLSCNHRSRILSVLFSRFSLVLLSNEAYLRKKNTGLVGATQSLGSFPRCFRGVETNTSGRF